MIRLYGTTLKAFAQCYIKKLAQHECCTAYHNYVSNLIDPHTNNKKFWSYIKSCRKDHTGIPTLSVDGNLITNDSDKANALNNQFASVFTQENISSIPTASGPTYPDMDGIEITTKGIRRLLSNLNPYKASGPGKIPTRFFKEFATEIAPCLTILFQASLNQGIIPDDWKKAFVVPIFKKGDRSSPSNY